jgi:hypothetical protein
MAFTVGALSAAMAEPTGFRALIASPGGPDLPLAAPTSACLTAIALTTVATGADCEHSTASLLTAVAHSKAFYATMYWFPVHFYPGYCQFADD